MATSVGALVRLRPATHGDVPEPAAIRETPDVDARWGGGPDHERGPDGTWHDNLLMDLLADELADSRDQPAAASSGGMPTLGNNSRNEPRRMRRLTSSSAPSRISCSTFWVCG